MKLSLPVKENSLPNENAQDNNSTIWERLSPEAKREVNKLRDKLGS